MLQAYKEFINRHSKIKICLLIAILLMIPTFALLNSKGVDYYVQVEQEIVIARKICEESRDVVLNDKKKLKFFHNTLNYISIDGQIPQLQYIKYPKAIYKHNGYAKNDYHIDLYCTFRDPRGAGATGDDHYYYDYRRGIWIESTDTRHYR